MKKGIKKLIILALTFALVLSSFNIAIAKKSDIDDRDYIRVGLYWGSTSKNEVKLESADGFIVYDENLNYIETIDKTSLVINTSSDLIRHKEFVYFMSAADDIDDRKITLTADSSKKVYRDGIGIYENSGLRIINYVTIDHYAWGVVNREMSSSNPEEALKAQAVAARTYAYRIKFAENSKHLTYGFDVCTTTDCQAYGGCSSESDKTTQACIDTAGEIMVYDGSPIFAYFSAASGGGYTQSLYDAWGLDDVPYLQSKKDEYTPTSNWSFYNTFDEIRSKIKNYYGSDIGTIQKFEITNTNDHGAATQITVTGSKGTKIVPRSQLMSVFNLKSTCFVLGAKDYIEFERNNSAGSVASNIQGLTGKVYVLSADGLDTIKAEKMYIYNGSSTFKYEPNSIEKISYKSEVCDKGYVYWTGQGNGHGIGLSQTGAIAMARDYGFDYKDILEYYYIDVDIIDYLEL